MEERIAGTRWILHSDQFCERGDSVNALEVRKILLSRGATDAVVMFDETSPRNSQKRIREAIRQGVDLRPYKSMPDFKSALKSIQPSHFYNFTAGRLADSFVSQSWPHRWRHGDYVVVNHVVFRNWEPHGDVYAFVSDWLYEWSLEHRSKVRRSLQSRIRNPAIAKSAVIGSLPHSVSIVPGNGRGFRRRFDLPNDAFVVGRIGGLDQFDDPVAIEGVLRWLNLSHNHYFVGVNTPVFTIHPRARFLGPLSRNEVSEFFAAIDVQINGRLMGESFGLSIVEGLRCGVPTIAPDECRNSKMDKHHIRILAASNWLYCTSDHILDLLSDFASADHTENASSLVSGAFTPEAFGDRLELLLERVL